jgi:DNA-binding transcriptional regulator GbsR (MarR family)
MNETTVRLRDKREPGHFWMDNEIIDVFGDELGQNGISVYGVLARYCYGTEVRMSLREIAGAARMSKDTVARAMKNLIAAGLVLESKGSRSKTASSWVLVSVKALVQGKRNQTVSPTDSLDMPQMERPVSSSKQVTLVDLVKERSANCLTMRQMNDVEEVEDKKICVSQDETDLSQNEGRFETDLSHQTVPFNKKQETRLKNKNYPIAPEGASGGFGLLDDATAAIQTECEATMLKCGISNPRILRVLAEAMRMQMARERMSPAEVRLMMVESWRRWKADARYMRHSIGPRKFFSESYWLDEQLWPVDYALIHRERQRHSRL